MSTRHRVHVPIQGTQSIATRDLRSVPLSLPVTHKSYSPLSANSYSNVGGFSPVSANSYANLGRVSPVKARAVSPVKTYVRGQSPVNTLSSGDVAYLSPRSGHASPSRPTGHASPSRPTGYASPSRTGHASPSRPAYARPTTNPMPKPTALQTGSDTLTGRKPGQPDWANQDRYLEVQLPGGEVLVGVFDGHGPVGHIFAQRVKDIFGDLGPGIAKATDTGVAFQQAFAQCLSVVEREEGSDFSGATATLALINPGKQTLSIANVGDSTAILIRPGGSIIFETKEHMAETDGERQRIEDHGGTVASGRVLLHDNPAHGLALARSIGDLVYKSKGVIAEPDVMCDLPFETGSILVVASDGLWDMVLRNEVVAAITAQATLQEVSQSLVAMAAQRWEDKPYMDDITVVITKSAPGELKLPLSPRATTSSTGDLSQSLWGTAASVGDLPQPQWGTGQSSASSRAAMSPTRRGGYNTPSLPLGARTQPTAVPTMWGTTSSTASRSPTSPFAVSPKTGAPLSFSGSRWPSDIPASRPATERVDRRAKSVPFGTRQTVQPQSPSSTPASRPSPEQLQGLKAEIDKMTAELASSQQEISSLRTMLALSRSMAVSGQDVENKNGSTQPQ